MTKELLIGCGSSREKRLGLHGITSWTNLVTLDNNKEHNPDVVWDLMNMPLPFEDETFDEIHAYEVLEHLGTQGDYKFFFKQFDEFYRLLKPDGIFAATCPSWKSPWAFGDPSHTRIIQGENLVFLDQTEYTKQVGKTAMSDFRYLYKSDFQRVFERTTDETLYFVLKAIKPSRIT